MGKSPCILSSGVWSIYFLLLSSKPATTRLCNTSNYDKSSNKCFWVSYTGQKTYDDADVACNAQGGRIAALDTKNKHIIALGLLMNIEKDAWIGLDDKKTEGKYIWKSTGKQLNMSSSWVKVEKPSSPDSDCLILKADIGTYHSQDCSETEKVVICEVTGSNPCATDNGGCEHKCEDVDGVAKCSCRDGFLLRSGTLCKPKVPPMKKVTKYLILLILFSAAATAIFAYTEREEAKMSRKSRIIHKSNVAIIPRLNIESTEKDDNTHITVSNPRESIMQTEGNDRKKLSSSAV